MNLRRLFILMAVSFGLLFSANAFAQEEGQATGDEAGAEGDADADAKKKEEAKEKEVPTSARGGEFGSEWGPVTISISGNKVTGKWKDGTFEGTIDENGVMTYDWVGPDDTSGKGTFVWDKTRWVGRWGYGASSTNGGDWTLYRAK